MVDPILPANNELHPNWFTDIVTLIISGGQRRPKAEFGNLFNEAVLDRMDARSIPTCSGGAAKESIIRFGSIK